MRLRQPLTVMVVESLRDSYQMRHRCQDNEDMEYLVRAAPDVEVAWVEAFWDPSLARELAIESEPLCKMLLTA